MRPGVTRQSVASIVSAATGASPVPTASTSPSAIATQPPASTPVGVERGDAPRIANDEVGHGSPSSESMIIARSSTVVNGFTTQ